MTYVDHPGRGVAMLACACGKVLDAADMCRRRHQPQQGAAALVERITCADCADVAVPLGRSIASVIAQAYAAEEARDDDAMVVWSRGGAA